MMRDIRQLCKALRKPKAAPHVYVGLETIIPFLQAVQPMEAAEIYELMLAITVCVLRKLSTNKARSDSPEDLVRQAVATFMPKDSSMKIGPDLNVLRWYSRVISKGYLELDWYANVPGEDAPDLEVLQEQADLSDEEQTQTIPGFLRSLRDLDTSVHTLHSGMGTMVGRTYQNFVNHD
jgi:hypothetical protein